MDAAQRLASLRQKVETRNAERVRAETMREQAQTQLNAILAEHGVSTVEELEKLAADAQAAANEALAAAEAALA